MYEKELRFFADIAAEVNEEDGVLPAVLGTWSDPEKPNAESFCIALEDLSVKYDALNGADGLTWEDACDLMIPVANWHAKYWQDDAFAAKHPWLSGATSEERGESCVWFDDWVAMFQSDKQGFWSKYCAHLLSGPDGDAAWEAVDLSFSGKGSAKLNMDVANPGMAETFELLTGPKGNAIVKAMYTKMATRPRTLIHGDMRPDNLFRSKEKNVDGKHDYKIVDWQAVAYGPAGVEFCEFLFGALPIESYPRMDELLGIYWAQLTKQCPAAAESYSLEMAKEDFAMTSALWTCALSFALTGILDTIKQMPEHPFWSIMGPAFQRAQECFKVLNLADVVKKIADEVAEEGAPPA